MNEHTVKIQAKDRMTGKWYDYNFRDENGRPFDGSLEMAAKEFATFEYSTMFVNYQIVSENGEILRDWKEERK